MSRIFEGTKHVPRQKIAGYSVCLSRGARPSQYTETKKGTRRSPADKKLATEAKEYPNSIFGPTSTRSAPEIMSAEIRRE